jgi:hypothetical protein
MSDREANDRKISNSQYRDNYRIFAFGETPYEFEWGYDTIQQARKRQAELRAKGYKTKITQEISVLSKGKRYYALWWLRK